MKRLFSALLTTVLFAASAFAAGPWDAGVPGNPNRVNPANINGTYQGSIKGKNISGIMVFLNQAAGGSVVGSSQGGAMIYFQGAVALASTNVVVDLAGRKITGVMDGASSYPNTLIVTAPATSTYLFWRVPNNLIFNGYFNANLSKNWAANSFSGKGNLLVKQFSINLYNLAMATAGPTAVNNDPAGYVASVPTPITVSGVKTADTSTTFTVTVPTIFPTSVGVLR